MACYFWWHHIFETDRRNVKRRTECFSEEFLHVCEEERWLTVSLQKFINEIHMRAATDRFLRSLPLNKSFSVISDPAFTEANRAFRAFAKDLRKTGNIAGVLEPIGNGKKSISNELMKRLFDSGELGRAGSKNPAQLQRTT